MIYPLETFFRKLRRRFSRSEWALRRLRLKASEETGSDPGLLLIQDHLYLLNTHFGLGRFERASQVADLLGEKWLGTIELNEPLIVCGDFNMVPGSLPYRALASRLHDVQLAMRDFRPLKTFAALFPFSRIDHIFVSLRTSLSLTPCFSWVIGERTTTGTVSTVSTVGQKPLKRF